MKHRVLSTLALTVLIAGATAATAQQAGERQRQRPQGREGFDPAQFQQERMNRIKESLNASDAEWAVMQPLIEQVTEKQRATMSGRFGPMGMRGGMGPGGPGAPGTPPGGQPQQPGRGDRQRADRPAADDDPNAAQFRALQEALGSETTPAAEIKDKLAAVRETRKKAETELKTARENLRKVLTVRQEAQLFVMGILD